MVPSTRGHEQCAKQQRVERLGYLQFITLGLIVLAFMGLSLAITATGTARFAVGIGYAPRSAMQSALSSTSPRRCEHLTPRKMLQ